MLTVEMISSRVSTGFAQRVCVNFLNSGWDRREAGCLVTLRKEGRAAKHRHPHTHTHDQQGPKGFPLAGWLSGPCSQIGSRGSLCVPFYQGHPAVAQESQNEPVCSPEVFPTASSLNK